MSVELQKDTFIIEGTEIGPDYVFSNGQELTNRQRRIAKKYLMKRDGLKCSLGVDMLQSDERIVIIADIHHKTKPKTWRAKDLALACHPHNSMHGSPTVASSPAYVCAQPGGVEGAARARERLYMEGTPAMKVNITAEAKFAEWLSTKVLQLGELSVEKAIDGGAVIADVSTETIKRYLRKLLSEEGPYKKDSKFGSKTILITLKKGLLIKGGS